MTELRVYIKDKPFVFEGDGLWRNARAEVRHGSAMTRLKDGWWS